MNKLPKGVYSFLDISTCHITKQDNDLILNTDFPLSVYEHDQGYFIHSGQCYRTKHEWTAYMEERAKELREFGMSEAFINLWKHAVSLDCWYLHLDADAEVHDEFPIHNW